MKKLFALLAIATLVAFAAPAFAANPFADVPMNHWAYDAVAQLAANGIVVGYPDGAYKGPQAATRYELAAVVARALANVDMNKASKQDLEMLKKLVVEFKSELDALGVKVDKLDARVAVLEEGVGGWKFSGELRFQNKWLDSGDDDWTLNRARIYFQKKVDDKITFYARMVGEEAEWDRFYAEVKLGDDGDWGTMWVGLWNMDWEDAAGLYNDNDAWFTDTDHHGFYYTKPFGWGDFHFYVAHEEEYAYRPGAFDIVENLVNAHLPQHSGGGGGDDYDVTKFEIDDFGWGDYYEYGARLNFNFGEKVRFALNGIMRDVDNDTMGTAVNFTLEDDYAELPWGPDTAVYTYSLLSGGDIATYWVDFQIDLMEGVAVKGAWYQQDQGWDYVAGIPGEFYDDSPNAWKVIVDVDQDVLKFTSLWLEYAKMDQWFFTEWQPYDNYGFSVTPTMGVGEQEVLFIRADQQWNDKWGTFVRYVNVNADLGWIQDAIDDSMPVGHLAMNDWDTVDWTFGVTYRYTPNMKFELLYDDIDDGQALELSGFADDSLIRLRTHITF